MIPISLNIYIYVCIYLAFSRSCHLSFTSIHHPVAESRHSEAAADGSATFSQASLAFRATEGNYHGRKLTCIVCQ